MVRLNDHPDMTIAVDWDVKHQRKQKCFKMIGPKIVGDVALIEHLL